MRVRQCGRLDGGARQQPGSPRLEALGGKPRLRLAGEAPYLSDNGNKILDVDFGAIEAPAALAARLDVLPGVMAHGLFVDLVDELHVGDTGASRVIRRSEVR